MTATRPAWWPTAEQKERADKACADSIEAKRLRAEAARKDEAAQESFDRSDTDGFLSQWAYGLGARKLRMQADILERGGIEVPALFDTDGNLVAAKLVATQYGTSWGLLATDDPHGRIVGWVNRSKARSAERRNATMAKKGYQEGRVLAPGKAEIMASGTGLSGAASAYVGQERTDGGFSRNVQVLALCQTEDWT